MRDSAFDRLIEPLIGSPAVRDLLQAGGLGVGAFSGQWDPLNELDFLLQRAVNAGKLNSDQLKAHLISYMGSIEAAYAIAMGAYAAQLDQKPNNAVTLYGSNAATGATYAGNTAITLYARVAGVLASSPGMILQPWNWIHRITCGDVDADAGWRLVGASVIIATDPVPSFPNDVSFSVFKTNLDRMSSPFVSLYNRPPYQQTTLTMQAMHNNTAATALLEGVTIEYYDNKCPMDQYSPLAPSPFKADPISAAQQMIGMVRQVPAKSVSLASLAPNQPLRNFVNRFLPGAQVPR